MRSRVRSTSHSPPWRLDEQRDVDLAGAQLVLALGWLGGDQRQFDAREALAEATDGGGGDRGAGAREGSEAQAAAAQARERLELGLGVGEPRQDHVGVADEHVAGLGEPDAAGVALDERRGRLALESGDLLGDGRLREVQRIGGGGEGSAGGNLSENLQSADFEHHRNLYQAVKEVICAYISQGGE